MAMATSQRSLHFIILRHSTFFLSFSSSSISLISFSFSVEHQFLVFTLIFSSFYHTLSLFFLINTHRFFSLSFLFLYNYPFILFFILFYYYLLSSHLSLYLLIIHYYSLFYSSLPLLPFFSFFL